MKRPLTAEDYFRIARRKVGKKCTCKGKIMSEDSECGI